MIGTRGSVDNQDKIVSAAVWCGLNIPSPFQMQGVPQEAVRRLQRRGGVPRVRGVRRGGVRGLQLRGGRGRGHGDTPHGDTAAETHSYQPHSGSTMVLFYLHKEEK